MNDMTRRGFVRATGATAAAAAVGLPAASTLAREGARSNHKPFTKVNCFSEDGELKEVIFGTMEGFRLLDPDTRIWGRGALGDGIYVTKAIDEAESFGSLQAGAMSLLRIEL